MSYCNHCSLSLNSYVLLFRLTGFGDLCSCSLDLLSSFCAENTNSEMSHKNSKIYRYEHFGSLAVWRRSVLEEIGRGRFRWRLLGVTLDCFTCHFSHLRSPHSCKFRSNFLGTHRASLYFWSLVVELRLYYARMIMSIGEDRWVFRLLWTQSSQFWVPEFAAWSHLGRVNSIIIHLNSVVDRAGLFL